MVVNSRLSPYKTAKSQLMRFTKILQVKMRPRSRVSSREALKMADLSCNVAGIKSPNPFWLASAPPTDKAYNVVRAFEAGWGGVVWKTLGEDPPIVNVSSRYGAVDYNGQKIMGFNNIELITDRPLDVN